MLINSPNISGSLTITGNSVITGSLTVLGGITGAITGSATTASYVEYTNVANKPALVSGSSQITYSGLTGIPSGIVSGSSQVTYSGLSGIPSGIVSGSAQITGFGIFATTGSNQFNGSQAITGSLTTTGTIVAQTLNVQQVTSSIVYSSGSNIFGNSLANTQQFTGSLQVTGSTHYLLGNLGIGTTSPDVFGRGDERNVGVSVPGTSDNLALALNAGGSAGRGAQIYMGQGGTRHFTLSSNATETRVGTATSTPLILTTNDTTRLTIAASTGAATFTSTISAGGGAFGVFQDPQISVRKDSNAAISIHLSNQANNSAATAYYSAGAFGNSWYWGIGSNSSSYGNDFVLRSDISSNNAPVLRISTSGAATFSSTVTATRGFFSSNAASDSTTGLLANATTNDSSTYAAIFGSLNAGYRMVVRADGNVGIGNTSPQGLLQIGANALSNNSDASNAFNLKQTSTTAATGIYLERSGERKGYYMYIGGSVDSLTFQRNNAGTKADVMSLTRDGNVGIGLDTPGAILDVSHTAGTTNIIRVSNGAGNYRWRVDQNFSMVMTNASNVDTFSVNTSGDVQTITGFQGRYYRIYEAGAARGGLYPHNLVAGSGTDYSVGIFSEGEIYFAPNGSATKRMIINSNNNVLIGTTSDNGRRLNVNGAGLFSGTLSTAKVEVGAVESVNITTNSTFTLVSSSYFNIRTNILVSVTIRWNNNANAQRQYLLFIGATDTGWGTPNSAISVIASNDWSSGYVGAATFSIGGSGQSRTLNISVANAATYNVTANAAIIDMS